MLLFKSSRGQSGGLGYHWRAFCHRESLWVPFRQFIAKNLEKWLETIPQSARCQVTLIGASAGHCLDSGFLSYFSRVQVSDPDPFAKLLWRHPMKPCWLPECSFTHQWFAENAPEGAILFCNLLGQAQWLESSVGAILGSIPSGVQVASFHDLLSGDFQIQGWDGPLALPASSASSAELLAEGLWEIGIRWEGELLDHFNPAILEMQSRAQWATLGLWQLMHRQAHVIQFAKIGN